MGRCIRRFEPTNDTDLPESDAIGRIKRSVLPLSPQSSGELGAESLTSVPYTVKSLPFFSNFAPSAERQLTVALTSSQSDTPRTVLFPFDRAAEIRSLCDALFEGGAKTLPAAALFSILTLLWKFL